MTTASCPLPHPPGLQLYASRSILPNYEARVNVDQRVASRLWLIPDNLRDSASRATIRTDVGPSRRPLLPVVRQDGASQIRLAFCRSGDGRSCRYGGWSFPREPLLTRVYPNRVLADQARA